MTVLLGDCLDSMAAMDADSVDSIVSDPPYGLAFMGKVWDHGVPGEPFWREALRVAKPGAYLVAFGGTRTFHRLTCAIEDAGWEIRDCLSWLYGSGFPKSHNGPWGGTALKPAWEPIILARKPLIGTVAKNVEAHGTGALNVDGCRIGTGDNLNGGAYAAKGGRSALNGDERVGASAGMFQAGKTVVSDFAQPSGRWPANVCLDEEAAGMLDLDDNALDLVDNAKGRSRFFYTAKASRREREAGLEGMVLRPPAAESAHSTVCSKCNRQRVNVSGACECDEPEWVRVTQKPTANHHPTVKPIALMRWLCRLVTPPNGLVLDPFTGSGTTGCAAVLESFRFIGCEKEAEYVAIAEKRIAHWAGQIDSQGTLL